jgi:hypothetical protein
MAPPDPKHEVKALSPLAIAVGLGSSAVVWVIIDLLRRVLQ